jgi:hypothetical protein
MVFLSPVYASHLLVLFQAYPPLFSVAFHGFVFVYVEISGSAELR